MVFRKFKIQVLKRLGVGLTRLSKRTVWFLSNKSIIPRGCTVNYRHISETDFYCPGAQISM
jgi:hypothetical protein